MRIIGGAYRGRRLRTARGMSLRPTPAPVRETLFNLIGSDIVGCRFLELFAGSGSVGIEALSCGAASVTFVDNHPTAIGLIRQNLEAIGIHAGPTLIRNDALRALESFHRRRAVFDLAFLDPPYDSDLAERCLLSPAWRVIMCGQNRIFIQHRRGLIWPPMPGWILADQRRFGETALTTFEREAKY